MTDTPVSDTQGYDAPQPPFPAREASAPPPSHGHRAPPPPPPPPGYAPYPAPARRGMGWCGVVFLLMVGLGGLGFVGLIFLGVVAQMSGGGTLGRSRGHDPIPEVVVHPGESAHVKIALIPVRGVIEGDPSPYVGQGSAFQAGERLRQAAADDEVKVVLLLMNTPGGGLTASDQLCREVRKVKDAGKKIVVWSADLNCSGGYYLSAPADHIVASPTSLVGSIGVIITRYDLSELAENIGLHSEPYKSGDAKNFGDLFHPATEEERAYFGDMVKHFHEGFVDVVAEGRKDKGLTREAAAELADGRAFPAAEAKEKLLVDEIGYFSAALERANRYAGVADARIITYNRPVTLMSLFTEARGGAWNPDALLRRMADAETPRLEARYNP